ncbi:DUF4041 domain-containing protein [Bradyrhizobium sp. USDA 10063]
MSEKPYVSKTIPWWGARKFARGLQEKIEALSQQLATEKAKTDRLADIAQDLVRDAKEIQAENERLKSQMGELGVLPVAELEVKRADLASEVDALTKRLASERASIEQERAVLQKQISDARQTIVETREIALLQEAGIYEYNHPLREVVGYESALKRLHDAIKVAVKSDGGAIQCATNWEVNGSQSEGKKMVREISKLMLRAFNAEVDAIIRALKPYKQESAIDRLRKVEETIRRLGKTMQIQISPSYFQLRTDEIKLTSDYLQKQAEEKQVERQERERMREERKAQQEMERERAKLEKERQHYENALDALIAKGDETGANRVREHLNEVAKAMEDVDFRAANIRAGYVYVISNIGSFGEKMVKIGMTRRLDPMDRIRELSDASVPFNFDVHALFFSKDAVGIESAMHDRLADVRVNAINHRREFFHVTAEEAKAHLTGLAGELLQFDETAEALEYRQTLRLAQNASRPIAI